MTALTQSTKKKLSLLQLAEELGNVSKACKIMGYHRDTFYEVRRAFQVGGVAILHDHIVSFVVWLLVEHYEGVCAPMQDQVLAVALLGNHVAEQAAVLFGAEDVFHAPGGEDSVHQHGPR